MVRLRSNNSRIKRIRFDDNKEKGASLLNHIITVSREEFNEKMGFFSEVLLNAGALKIAPHVCRYILEFEIID